MKIKFYSNVRWLFQEGHTRSMSREKTEPTHIPNAITNIKKPEKLTFKMENNYNAHHCQTFQKGL